MPSTDFGTLPDSLSSEIWTPAEFAARGFTYRKLPTEPVTILKAENWDSLVTDLRKHKRIAAGSLPILKEIKGWLHKGVPEYVHHPGTTPTNLPHHISQDQVHMALESIEAFLRAGHLAGPFTANQLPWPEKEAKYISLFGKQRPHGGSLRLINDHSSPPGISFNDGISDALLDTIPLEISTLEEVIKTLLITGKGSYMSKYDLKEAFQTHGVQTSQYKHQVYRILSSIFVCTKMTYGDKNACHRFSRSHEVMLRHLILPQCRISPKHVSMCVDDVCDVVGAEKTQDLAQLDYTYKRTLNYLGFETKKTDPLGFKAYHRLQKGEVLGVLLDTKNHLWSLSTEKNSKIIEAIDEVYHRDNIGKTKKVTLKQAQKCQGKLNALTACQKTITRLILFVNRDLTLYLRKYPEENMKAQQYQNRNFQFTQQARKELRLIRAVLHGIRNHWVPVIDPDTTTSAMVDIVCYTDASAKLDLKPGDPKPALGVLIPTQVGAIARAVSFPIPMDFLKGKDDFSYNYGNTMLWECLAMVATLLRYPNSFRNKSTLFITDCSSLVRVYNKGRPKGFYLCWVFKLMYKIEETLNCTVKMTWQRRCSSPYMTAADTLTHQSQQDTPEHVKYRRVENLPYPIAKTLQTSVIFEENTFHRMWQRTTKYWENPKKYVNPPTEIQRY